MLIAVVAALLDCLVLRTVRRAPEAASGSDPAALLRSFLTEFASLTQDDGTDIGWRHLCEAADESGLLRIGREFDVQGEWLASRHSEEIMYIERWPRHPNAEATVTWPTIWHVACALAGCPIDSTDRHGASP